MFKRYIKTVYIDFLLEKQFIFHHESRVQQLPWIAIISQYQYTTIGKFHSVCHQVLQSPTSHDQVPQEWSDLAAIYHI